MDGNTGSGMSRSNCGKRISHRGNTKIDRNHLEYAQTHAERERERERESERLSLTCIYVCVYVFVSRGSLGILSCGAREPREEGG